MGPEQAELRRLYQQRFSPADRKQKDRIWKAIVEGCLQRWIAPGDAVLDIGCGYGEFLNHLRCARRIGVDLNPDAPAHLATGVEFHAGDVRDLAFLRDGEIDVVFASNVLEHLGSKGDVERVVEEVRRVLKPGGHVVVMGPNIRVLPGAYWDFWDHMVPISDRSMSELLESRGFRIAACVPRFLPYTTRSHYPQSPVFVRLYLALRFLWPLFGRQFLIRAAKQ